MMTIIKMIAIKANPTKVSLINDIIVYPKPIRISCHIQLETLMPCAEMQCIQVNLID